MFGGYYPFYPLYLALQRKNPLYSVDRSLHADGSDGSSCRGFSMPTIVFTAATP
jgi:hypothetical protein